MLPAANRLTRSQDFGLVVRRGRRAGRSRLVVHVLLPSATAETAGAVAPAAEAEGTATTVGTEAASNSASAGPRTSAQPTLDQSKVGFVVSKAVGNSVVRHQVSRRLRHVVRDRLDLLPPGTSLVVRALAPSAEASSAELGRDLDAALHKVLR
ncbi:ribonuclease P protein component [Saccharothrix ecbatanensis]|uniref:Ribonuclease P protein component n=1 Tax=Saccharothrix ecbatanensis TaxID=1105145 RepID=A0A7W9HRP5_9PSEU|nr:ribonuclease P protein component [Saccharothrix ecbatanensis]MBB5806798.1 ribonuclease P protein component [Saccharothrix ecbatanensis]